MRLFVAILLDKPFQRAVLDYQSSLRRAAESGNFSHPDNLHITLAFIGESRTPDVALRAVRGVSFEPFELSLERGGTFGSLYWVGVDGGNSLRTLAGDVRTALSEAKIPFDPKPFKAHITVAREVTVREKFSCAPIAAKMTVSRIALMKSERINGRVIYSEVRY